MTAGMTSTTNVSKPIRTGATHTVLWASTPLCTPSQDAQERVLELARHLDKTARLSIPLTIHLAPYGTSADPATGDIGVEDRPADGNREATVDLLMSNGRTLSRRIVTALPWSELPARLTRLLRNFQVEGCNKDTFATWTSGLSDAELRERLGIRS